MILVQLSLPFKSIGTRRHWTWRCGPSSGWRPTPRRFCAILRKPERSTQLPFVPYELDDSFTRTEPGRPHVPQGYYLAEVASVSPTAKDYDKTPGFNVSFKILEAPTSAPGAGVGREIGRYASMGGKAGSQFGMAGMMGAAGIGDVARALYADERFKKVSTWEKHAQIAKFIDSKMRGKRVVLTIGDEMSPQGRSFSSIIEVQSAANWDQQKGTPLVGGIGPQPAPSNGGAPAAATLADQVSAMFEQPDVA